MIALLAVGTPSATAADKAAELSKDSQAALASLYAKVPAAKALGAKAQAILVFPNVTKSGLGIGGQHGDGALLRGGKAVGYYSTSGASFGLQAGGQTYGYAMFFMNDDIYAFIFSQKGLMGGLGIQGNNIRKIDPK